MYYQVKWKGYKKTTWEPEPNVSHMTDMIYYFGRELAKKEREKRDQEERKLKERQEREREKMAKVAK